RAEQTEHWDLDELRVADVSIAIGEGELLRRDKGIDVLRRPRREAVRTEQREQVQHLEGRDTLTVWGRREDLHVPVVGFKWRCPLAPVVLQVFETKEGSRLTRGAIDLAGDLSAVEAIRAQRCNSAKCLRKLREAENRACPMRKTLGIEKPASERRV